MIRWGYDAKCNQYWLLNTYNLVVQTWYKTYQTKSGKNGKTDPLKTEESAPSKKLVNSILFRLSKGVGFC